MTQPKVNADTEINLNQIREGVMICGAYFGKYTFTGVVESVRVHTCNNGQLVILINPVAAVDRPGGGQIAVGESFIIHYPPTNEGHRITSIDPA